MPAILTVKAVLVISGELRALRGNRCPSRRDCLSRYACIEDPPLPQSLGLDVSEQIPLAFLELI